MSEKYKFHNKEGIYFVILTVVHWIDLFTSKDYKHIIINVLQHCQKEKNLKVYAYVIMPSHLHLIVSSTASLSDTLRDFKKHTSKAIIKEIKQINESRAEWLLRAFSKAGKHLRRITNYKVWQDGNHPIELNNADILEQKLEYVHSNPVEFEIVDEPEYYWYSSARDYMGSKGLMDVDLLK